MCLSGGKIMKTALQLYSIRDLCSKDFFGTLENVAKAGYSGVEFAGYYDKPFEEIREVLDKNGLVAAGTHVGYDAIAADIDNSIKGAKVLGLESMVVPYAQFDSAKGWEDFALKMNKLGVILRKEGIIFGYHNHAHELLQKYDGKPAMDIILENSDPLNVCWEMDTHWAAKGGFDPVERAEKYKNRMPLIHAKDIGSDGEDTEAGSGSIKFDDIVKVLTPGLKWIIVEQEKFDMDMLESIKISASNMNSICKKY